MQDSNLNKMMHKLEIFLCIEEYEDTSKYKHFYGGTHTCKDGQRLKKLRILFHQNLVRILHRYIHNYIHVHDYPFILLDCYPSFGIFVYSNIKLDNYLITFCLIFLTVLYTKIILDPKFNSFKNMKVLIIIAAVILIFSSATFTPDWKSCGESTAWLDVDVTISDNPKRGEELNFQICGINQNMYVIEVSSVQITSAVDNQTIDFDEIDIPYRIYHCFSVNYTIPTTADDDFVVKFNFGAKHTNVCYELSFNV